MAEASGLRKWIRRVLVALVVLAVVGLIVVAWIPNPVEVEVAQATRGPLVVTVNEDGRTRVKDRYIVSAPITGNLARLELDAGDSIEEEQVLARLVPLPPPVARLSDPGGSEGACRRSDGRSTAGSGCRQPRPVPARFREAGI